MDARHLNLIPAFTDYSDTYGVDYGRACGWVANTAEALIDNASSDEAIYDESALAALLADVTDRPAPVVVGETYETAVNPIADPDAAAALAVRTCRKCTATIARAGEEWVVTGTGTSGDGLSYCPPDPDAACHGKHLPAAQRPERLEGS